MGVQTTVTVTNRSMFKKLSALHKNKLKDFGNLLGTAALTAMQKRLIATYEPDGRRTGLLANSLTVGNAAVINRYIKDGPNRSTVEVGSSIEYAAMQDRGGTIRPKAGNRMLAIPLTDKLRIDGRSPKDLDPNRSKMTLLVPEDGGNPVLIDKKNILGFGKKPLFVLVPKVEIEPKNFTDHPTVLDDILEESVIIYRRFVDRG